ncbi:unnamed protein product [Ambrosiozyma monospora]|uniref:Unnamed protein product n=1 Tax=Ambrosiozyma monospora TaxID=43982 RepID=A0A9W7DEV0_AMBMO|nr:unnamed protein product [Ambrosiozyma monospora]
MSDTSQDPETLSSADQTPARETAISQLPYKFETDAGYAIQLSLNQKLPLLMLIREDSDESTSWIIDHFDNHEHLSQFVKDLLLTSFINLDILKDSTNFQLFLQIFPQFINVSAPCVVIIHSGMIVDIITTTVTPLEFGERLKKAHSSLKNIEGVAISSQQQTATSSRPVVNSPSVPQHSPLSQPQSQLEQGTSTTRARESQHQSTPPLTPNLAQTTSNTEISSSSSSSTNETTHRPSQVPSSVPASSSGSDAAKKARRYSSLKEQAAEVAAQKHRENLIKQKRLDRLERERILKLLQADREERKRHKIAEKEENSEKVLDLGPVRPVHDNLHNKRLEESEEYTLQVKLFDGKSFRAKFKKTDTLFAVREYVLEHYTEYQQLPFYFFKTIDRITLSDADEDKTLKALKLNRTTLIMKPIDPYAKKANSDKDNEASNTAAGQTDATSSFSWLKNTVSSYLWGSQNNNQPTQGSSSTHPNRTIQGTSSSSNINPAQSSSLHYTPATSPQYHDYDGGEISDSQSESVYHSPELRSRSMSPAPQLASSLHSTGGQQNSFNLYGAISQSGLGH